MNCQVSGRRKGRKGSKKEGNDELYKSLKKKINITREEFDKSHREFQGWCPTGKMTKEQFLEKSRELLGVGIISESLFRVFDEDERFFIEISISSLFCLIQWLHGLRRVYHGDQLHQLH